MQCGVQMYGQMGAGVSGAKAIPIAVTGPSLSSVDPRASAVALRGHPREVHTVASRSTPAFRTENIMNRDIYGHGHGHEDGDESKDMFSFTSQRLML